ncbi:hypothetical protein HK102_014125, partial [Quaeritorhiza haematococci]
MPNTDWVDTNKYHAGTSPLGAEKIWHDHRLERLFTAANPEKTKLRKLSRNGIPDSLRGHIYTQVLQVEKLDSHEKSFQEALRRTYGDHVPEEPLPPTFGGRLRRQYTALNVGGVFVVEHVLCILSNDFPQLEYCPFVPPLAVLLAHHLRSPDELLGAMVQIVRKSLIKHGGSSGGAGGHGGASANGGDTWTYFPTFKKDVKHLGIAFGAVLNKHNQKLYRHLEKLYQESSDKEPFWLRWMTDFFVSEIPQEALWRMLDNFLIEGYKTLIRFGVALLQLRRDALMQCSSVEEVLRHFDASQPFYTTDQLYRAAWNISVSRSDVLPSKQQKLNAVSQDEVHDMQYKYQRGLPKMRHRSRIIKEDHWIALWSWIPPQLRLSEINLIFTTSEHGYNIATLYQMTHGKAPLLMFVQTLEGSVFGAFVSTSWPENYEERGRFGGNGETFLFTLEPYARMYDWVARADLSTADNNNSMFVMVTRKDLTIGGG